MRGTGSPAVVLGTLVLTAPLLWEGKDGQLTPVTVPRLVKFGIALHPEAKFIVPFPPGALGSQDPAAVSLGFRGFLQGFVREALRHQGDRQRQQPQGQGLQPGSHPGGSAQLLPPARRGSGSAGPRQEAAGAQGPGWAAAGREGGEGGEGRAGGERRGGEGKGREGGGEGGEEGITA